MDLRDTESSDINYGLLTGLIEYLLRHATLRGQTAFKAEFQDDGVTALQFMIAELVCQNGRITHSEICRAMRTSASVITTTLKPMLADGVLSAERMPTDHRQVRYVLTPKGETWFAAIRGRISWSEDRLCSDLDAQDREELARLLRKLAGIGQHV